MYGVTVIEGNLAREVEMRINTKTGKRYAFLTIIVNKRIEVDGRWIDTNTQAYEVSVFDDMAEHLDQMPAGELLIAVVRDLRVETNGKYTNLKAVAVTVGLSVRFNAALSLREAGTTTQAAAPAEAGYDDYDFSSTEPAPGDERWDEQTPDVHDREFAAAH